MTIQYQVLIFYYNYTNVLAHARTHALGLLVQTISTSHLPLLDPVWGEFAGRHDGVSEVIEQHADATHVEYRTHIEHVRVVVLCRYHKTFLYVSL